MFKRTILPELIITYIELDKREPTFSWWASFKFYLRLTWLFRKAHTDTRATFIFSFLEKEVKDVIATEEGSMRSIRIGICKDKISILIKIIEQFKYAHHTKQLRTYCKELQEALDKDTYTLETKFLRRIKDLREEMDAIVLNPMAEMVFHIQKQKLPIIYESFMEVWKTLDVRFEELRVLTHLIFESKCITKETLNKGLYVFISPMLNSNIAMTEAIDSLLNRLFPWESEEELTEEKGV